MQRSKRSFEHKKTATLPLLFFAFGLLMLVACSHTPRTLRSFPTPDTASIGAEEGMKCPNLMFEDEQGHRKELRDYRGKIVFINFWGSWCVPCQREIPSIQKLYDALKSNEGIEFIMLSTKRDFAASRQYARSLGYTFHLYKSTPPGDRPMLTFGTIPRTLILDRNGIVIVSKTGVEYWNYWEERIQELIRTSSAARHRQYGFAADGIRVDVEVVDDKPNSSIRLVCVPEKGIKLSAKRGIVLSAGEKGSVKWVTPLPVSHVREDTDYFFDPPDVTLFFVSSAHAGAIDLTIEYGYCKAESEECVPAKTVIEVPFSK